MSRTVPSQGQGGVPDDEPAGSLGPRWVWLDGGNAPGWDRSVLAAASPADPSLTWSADTGLVLRHSADPGDPGRWRSEVVGDDPFVALAEHMAPGEDWYGWFGYASRSDLPARARSHDRFEASRAAATGSGQHGSPAPDAVWMRASLVLDLPAAAPAVTPAPPGPVPPMPPDYLAAFEAVQDALRAGHSYEVNLTQRGRAVGPTHAWQVARALRRANPAPFSGVVAHDVPGHFGALVSASPERYLHVADRQVETRPIKGTSPRGATLEADRALAEHLRSDPKTRAENLMVADLLRHDVALVSKPGSVQVPELMVVESHPSVHQLVTSVTGELKDSVSVLEAVRSLFPPGSMTGAPKLRTMEVIRAVEADARGVYAGTYGHLTCDSADLAVVIRSLSTGGDGTWEWGAGGGITVDSDAASEWAELCWKADRIRGVLSGS